MSRGSVGAPSLLSATLVALAALLLLACGADNGDADAEPLPSGHSRAAAAAVANELNERLTAGDGEGACALMTDRGQEFFVKFGRNSGFVEGDAGCAEVVAAAASAAEDDPGAQQPAPFESADVALGPTELPGAERGAERYAELACQFRGSLGLERTDQGWRAIMPACFD